MLDPPCGTQRRQTREWEFRETVCKIIRDQGYRIQCEQRDAGRICLKCIHNVLITFGHGGWNICALYSCDQYQHLSTLCGEAAPLPPVQMDHRGTMCPVFYDSQMNSTLMSILWTIHSRSGQGPFDSWQYLEHHDNISHSRNQMYNILRHLDIIALSFNFNFTASPSLLYLPPHKNVVTSLSVSGHHWCAAPGWEVSGGSQQPSPLESHSLLPATGTVCTIQPPVLILEPRLRQLRTESLCRPVGASQPTEPSRDKQILDCFLGISLHH